MDTGQILATVRRRAASTAGHTFRRKPSVEERRAHLYHAAKQLASAPSAEAMARYVNELFLFSGVTQENGYERTLIESQLWRTDYLVTTSLEKWPVIIVSHAVSAVEYVKNRAELGELLKREICDYAIMIYPHTAFVFSTTHLSENDEVMLYEAFTTTTESEPLANILASLRFPYREQLFHSMNLRVP